MLKLKAKRNHMIAAVYLGAIVICLFIYLFLPVESMESVQMTENERIHIDELYRKFENGQWEQIPDEFIKKQETSFQIETEKLIMDYEDRDVYSYPIMVERKAENDGVIEIYSFAAGSLDLRGFEMLMEIPLPGFELNGDTLKMLIPQSVQIEKTLFTNEWPINQFDPDKIDYNDSGWGYGYMIYFYMKIPQDLPIESTVEYGLEFVEE
ncbi:hypothetical protein P4U44_05250 [Alkalihalobacillus alcalophilus]|nr:hypothetical protein [Alkalihalobacillus alcalophilus]MED1561315.1 hypothetical protein [Alkalihalobacillus alcalophilus]